jgi:signal peptidase II
VRGLQERGAVAALRDDPLVGPRADRARLAVIGLTAVVVTGLDQLTKTLAVGHLAHGPIHVIGPLDLRLTYNTGAAFSLGRGLGPLIVVVGIVLVGLLIGLGRTVPTVASAVAVGMILGGAVGNLVDRLARGNGGAVIDFVDFHFWPTFNLADACIVVGAVLLVVSIGRHQARQ